MTGPEGYALARMRGLSVGEAAKEAGYACDPPRHARDLWTKCEMLLDDMATCPTVHDLERSIEHQRAAIERLTRRMQSDLAWLRAVRLVRHPSNCGNG